MSDARGFGAPNSSVTNRRRHRAHGEGFHIAYVNVQNLYGSPTALDAMDKFYDHVTREYGLMPKVALEGFSRGGLFALNWAARHPERVACIYNDAPVCDFKSWPGGRGKGKGSPAIGNAVSTPTASPSPRPWPISSTRSTTSPRWQS